MPLISIVVPCCNEQDSVPLLFDTLLEVMQTMREDARNLVGVECKKSAAGVYSDEIVPNFEIVFVDDGSCDGTLQVIKQLDADNSFDFVRIKWLEFSRNFGKEAALYAGLKTATGDFVVTMDADMQDPPNLMPEMYQILVEDESYDDVATYRIDRKGESHIRSFFARLFYKIMNRISDADIKDGARDYRFMRRRMVDAILSLGEYNRFSKGIYGWVGFNTKWIPFENIERVAGTTSWSFSQLFSYSIEGMVSFSTKPLQIASASGFIFCLLAAILLIFIVVRTLAFGDPVSGWPSLVCIVLFVGGLQLLCMGIFGQYLARDYLESKKRPLYIVRESNIGE